jgi:outer membrane protein assembly factor BamB
MTASYDAGSVMVRVRRDGDTFKAESVFDMKHNEWNSEVHTPIVHKGHLFAVGKKKRGLFTCLSFDGKEVWTSEGKPRSAWAAFMLADGMFFVMDGDTGKLRLIEASTTDTTSSPALRFSNGTGSLGADGIVGRQAGGAGSEPDDLP